MRYLSLVLSLILLLVLSSCSVTPAKTMDEFRQTVKYVKREVFNSKIPYPKVAKILENRFEVCMNLKIDVSEGETHQSEHIFNPVTNFGDYSGQASLQIHSEYRVTLINDKRYELPPGGEYVVLADIKKQADGKTQLSIIRYYTSANVMYTRIADITAKIIKSWSQGENLNACPNY